MKLYKKMSVVLAGTMAVGMLVGFTTPISGEEVQVVVGEITSPNITTGAQIEIGDEEGLESTNEAEEREVNGLQVAYINDAGIGSSAATAGICELVDGKLTMGATKGKLQSGNDNVYFAYIPVTGDFTFTARISGTAAVANNFKGLLMAKNGLDATSAHVSIGLESATKSCSYTRIKGPSSGSRSTLVAVEMPTYVRMERIGDTYKVYISQDGTFDKPNKEYTNSEFMGAIDSTLNVGFAVCDGEIIFDAALLQDSTGNVLFEMGESLEEDEAPTATDVEAIEDIAVIEGQKVTLPTKVKVMYSNNTSKEMPVTWENEVDTTIVGEQVIAGKVVAGEKVFNVTVKVIVEKRVLKQIRPFEAITVVQGEAVVLPKEAELEYNDGSVEKAPVVWELEVVDAEVIGIQTISGIIVVDGEEKEVKIEVIVNEKERDLVPPEVTLKVVEDYKVGEDLTFEIVSNEAGVVVIEINDEIAYTGELVQLGNEFAYAYKMLQVQDEELVVFVTVSDEEANTATTYSYAATQKSEVTPTPVPTDKPEVTPTPLPTDKPEATPTPLPTDKPEATPTPLPTGKPEATPTPVPTEKPSGGSGSSSSSNTSAVKPSPSAEPVAVKPRVIISTDKIVTKDGQTVELIIKPFVEKGRVCVGIKDMALMLGEEVLWDHKTKTVTIKSRGITLTVGQDYALVAGEKVALGIETKILNGRVVVPVAQVARLLGREVDYDNATKQIMIK